MKDGGGVYPNLLQIEATLRLLESRPLVTIPADNRRLVENALHPEVLDAIAEELGVAWANHAADCAGHAYAERGQARDLSLDLATPFRELSFPDDLGRIATRLGEQQLLIDVEPAMEGPFGKPVERIAIPHWMARGAAPDERPELLGRDERGWRFRLGERSYVYGRWGLAPLA